MAAGCRGVASGSGAADHGAGQGARGGPCGADDARRETRLHRRFQLLLYPCDSPAGHPADPHGRRPAGRAQRYAQYDVPVRHRRGCGVGSRAGARLRPRFGTGLPGARRAYPARAGGEHLPFAAVRPQFRILRRRSLSGGRDGGGLYRGDAGRRGHGLRQTLRRQQPGVEPPPRLVGHRRADAP